MGGKLGRLLEEIIRKRVAENPASPVEIVVTPRRGDEVEAILRELQSVGGNPNEITPDAIRCQVPAGQVRRLASSELVAEIRPARVHRAH